MIKISIASSGSLTIKRISYIVNSKIGITTTANSKRKSLIWNSKATN